MNKVLHVGLDVGSTTIKAVVLNETGERLSESYLRHRSDVRTHAHQLLSDLAQDYSESQVTLCVTGSSGLFLSECLDIPFVQEVVACTKAVESRTEGVDVVVELGGEDAKITYFGNSLEQRMNGICAGGTGAFVDQMASLLDTDAAGLNELAREATTLYPIASRCGVFAKTDIQPLLNEGTPKADIAASVLQAVVNQTIAGLACGRPIRGRVLYLGGPLHFLDQLRERFTKTLKLTPENALSPEDGHYFVALGAALTGMAFEPKSMAEHVAHLDELIHYTHKEATTLPVLFESPKDYRAFQARHAADAVHRRDLRSYQGPIYVGIDAGSTTTKIVALDDAYELLFSHYIGNKGNPLESCVAGLKILYGQMNEGAWISKSVVTGYGESLLKSALKVDHGEIETMAHFKGATYFVPNVDFILDIGGQDMKSMKVRSGNVESIMLNEACSSGCGSFIETFAKSLDMELPAFVEAACEAKQPVDLGTRCTVFMNSRVKQAQKEGASVGDISAGIAYSVVKNALYKVIRLKSTHELGKRIVVQGGTFYNDAVLRAFEIITGAEVVRPDIAGVMGAFGAACIAIGMEDGEPSTLLDADELEWLKIETKSSRCKGCGNHCLLTINHFDGERRFISGNRCEKGSGEPHEKNHIPNLYEYKYKRVFDYVALSPEEAPRGTIGIPRVLNMYEHYPFWHTLFTQLGYRVVLSERSSKAVFERGMASIPSESVCYPAKLAHGHVDSLIDKGVKRIFYPAIPYEMQDGHKTDNNFNCPIVTSYPEAVRMNNDSLKAPDVSFMVPFLPLYDPKAMHKRCRVVFQELGLYTEGLDQALDVAYAALDAYKADLRQAGEAALRYIEDNNGRGIVLAGRPYHADPEIHHGIPDMLSGFGLVVLSEDSVAHLSKLTTELRVLNQWTYHARMYHAAEVVSKNSKLELVQLNSFGCGLDAVTTDQVSEILAAAGKSHTVLKIDEINNLGAARIRMRSLIALIKEKEKQELKGNKPVLVFPPYQSTRRLFTKAMKKTHTLLCPQMSPIHFQFFEPAMAQSGYQLKVLEKVTSATIDVGLRSVHNDACYPSIIVVGQLIEALSSGAYDLDETAVVISQTGGGCRASNYVGFIRKALKDAGYEQVPVVSLSAGGIEKNPGFSWTPALMKRLCMGVLFGDLLMRMVYKTRPYERDAGAVNALAKDWTERCKETIVTGSTGLFNQTVRDMVEAFDQIPLRQVIKPKIGIVGEILVKFHPDGNNHLVEFLEAEGCEVVMPDLTDFLLYCSYNKHIQYDLLARSYWAKLGGDIFITYIERYRRVMKQALDKSKRFTAPKPIEELAQSASKVLSLGHQTGEGWFLTAEIVELLEDQVNTIACLQPFACLPNHITGKGVIKLLREKFPKANIAPIDYDPGASEVNQINRIKLMLAHAK